MQLDEFIGIRKLVEGEILALDEHSKYRFDHSFLNLDEIEDCCIPFIAPTQSTLNAAVERKHRKQKKTDEPTKKIKGKFDDELRAEARRNEVGRFLYEKMIVLPSTINSYIEFRQQSTYMQANLRGKIRESGLNHDKLKTAAREMRLQRKKMDAKGWHAVMICLTSAQRASIDNLPSQITLEMSNRIEKTRIKAKNRNCLPKAHTRITHSQGDGTPDMHLIAYFDSEEKADKYYTALTEEYDLGRTSMQEADEGVTDYVCRQRASDGERELALLAWAWVWDVRLHSASREDNRGLLKKIKEGKKHSNRHRQYRTADLNITPDLNFVLVEELDLKETTKDEWFCLSDFYIDDDEALTEKLKTTEETPRIDNLLITRRAHAQGSYIFSNVTPSFCLPIRFLLKPRQPVRPTACKSSAATPKRRPTRRELVRSLTQYVQPQLCRALLATPPLIGDRYLQSPISGEVFQGLSVEVEETKGG